MLPFEVLRVLHQDVGLVCDFVAGQMGVILVFFYHFAYLSCFYDLGARKKADTIQSQIYMNGSVLSQEMVRTFFKEKLNSSADLGTYHVCCVLSFLKVVIAWHYVSENPLLSSQFLGLQGPSYSACTNANPKLMTSRCPSPVLFKGI